jgi:hypothetical protein
MESLKYSEELGMVTLASYNPYSHVAQSQIRRTYEELLSHFGLQQEDVQEDDHKINFLVGAPSPSSLHDELALLYSYDTDTDEAVEADSDTDTDEAVEADSDTDTDEAVEADSDDEAVEAADEAAEPYVVVDDSDDDDADLWLEEASKLFQDKLGPLHSGASLWPKERNIALEIQSLYID